MFKKLIYTNLYINFILLGKWIYLRHDLHWMSKFLRVKLARMVMKWGSARKTRRGSGQMSRTSNMWSFWISTKTSSFQSKKESNFGWYEGPSRFLNRCLITSRQGLPGNVEAIFRSWLRNITQFANWKHIFATNLANSSMMRP